MGLAAAALVVLEYGTAPLSIQTIRSERPPVYAWVSAQPRQLTLELPVPLRNAPPLHDAFYMYAQTWHWHPLANGYSGHYTQDYIDRPDGSRRPSRCAVITRDEAHRNSTSDPAP